MDFLSLFDPSDGQNKAKKRYKEPQDNVKKKPEGTTKGRRRGRRAGGKSDTLPEESSFLNEPALSTELVLKDGSYIDSYIDMHQCETKQEKEDKKIKKRNAGRKARRRKKIPPAKEPPFEKMYTSNNNLSLRAARSKLEVGKNVNDLTDFKAPYRIDGERELHEAVEKLEKVNLRDDMYLEGDFEAKEVDSDFFYSDEEDCNDDSTSDSSESCASLGGSLPPEPRFGNVEYKLRLSTHCERRFQHLVTQLKWRLVSGGGRCVYVVGVRDCGALAGLRARALRGSLRALRRMALAVHARVASARLRKVHAHRAVAEVYIKKVAPPQQSAELRVAVMGANEAGKSTLIGVLTQGELDNGNGSARLNMFRHQHEVKTGMTSSLSHEILGFDAQGNVVNYGCSELMTAERIGERSAKLVSFLDLAGHSKYQRTTRHGLTGYSPHVAMLVISATAGITAITEEHMGILSALRLPFFVVLTRCEPRAWRWTDDNKPTCAAAPLRALTAALAKFRKKPLLITDEELARSCCAPPSPSPSPAPAPAATTASPAGGARGAPPEDNTESWEQVAVFPVSCVKGLGLRSLHAHLRALQPPPHDPRAPPEEETCEFQIDEVFHVGDSGGPVVGGLLTRGRLYERDRLLIGPLEDGSFRAVAVRSIYRNRVPCGAARAAQPASLGLQHPCPPVRPGMVLLAIPEGYKQGRRRAWPPCPPPCKTRLQLSQMIRSLQAPAAPRPPRPPHHPHHPRRHDNKNLLQDILHAEEVLTKDMDNDVRNLYTAGDARRRQSEGKYHPDADAEAEAEAEGDCICEDRVPLEDPRDPRGCLYFQASVHVIRHSTGIHPGYQCTVHVGSVRQTAVIEGIMSRDSVVRAGESASVLFRFVRTPEYLAPHRQLLFTQGLGTRGVGRITQIFPHVP